MFFWLYPTKATGRTYQTVIYPKPTQIEIDRNYPSESLPSDVRKILSSEVLQTIILLREIGYPGTRGITNTRLALFEIAMSRLFTASLLPMD
jgi:hypothetical protein